MAYQPNGWSQGPSDSEARWRESDRALKLHSFKVALGIFGGLAVLRVVLMAAAHVVFIPFLTIIMGIRAAIIGWHVFGKEQATLTRYAATPPTGWQQSAPVPPPPPPLVSQAPPAAGHAPSGAAVPPPPPPTWAPRQDLGDWSQSMPASPKPQSAAPAPPPPPPPSS